MPPEAGELFRMDVTSGVEKYRQLVDGVIEAVRLGRLRRGDPLPPVSAFCGELGLAKATVIKAFALLRERGIVTALPRKGYFVATESVGHQAKVLLLFDEFPAYKQVLYDSFMAGLGGRAVVDIFFHHCVPSLFESLLLDKLRHYDLAVVMPFADKAVGSALSRAAKDKVLILDRADQAGKNLPRVVQEFEASLLACLEAARDRLDLYRRFLLVFPPRAGVAIKSSQAPREILRAFARFCKARGMEHAVFPSADGLPLEKGDAVLLIDDGDLVAVVELARERGFGLGAEVGVLSYNDAPVKRVVDRGISVISTDFAELGLRAARYVIERKFTRETVPTRLILRGSL